MVNESLEDFRAAFREMLDEKQTVKYFFSCVSEGLIPCGLRKPFNLAKDVNDIEFVQSVQNECDIQSSRLLDLFLKQRQKRLNEATVKYETVHNSIDFYF